MLIRIGKAIGIQKDYELWLAKSPELVTLNTKVTNTGNTETENSYQNEPEKLPILESELPEWAKKVTSSNDTQKKKENIQKKPNKRKTNSYPHTKGPVDPNKFIRGQYSHMVNR